MDLIQLQKIATILQGLETGTWLEGQLELANTSSTSPRVLVLVSAQQEVERAFPGGLKLEPEWIVWTGEGSPEATDVEQVDLLLWGMAALAMFPGEYAAALEHARREGIPIWAVVVGLGRLSEKAEFLRRRLPTYQASLAEHSEIIVHQGAKDENVSERIIKMLHEHAALLSQRGTTRRLTRLAARVSARLATERKLLQEEAQHAEQFATTGQRGLRSLKILVSTAVSKILEEYNPLHEQFQKLRQELSDDIEVEDGKKTLDELGLQLQQSLSSWRKVILEPEINRLTHLTQQRLVKWCKSYSEDLSGFFSASRSLMPGDDAQKSRPTLESEALLEKTAPLFAAIQRDLLKNFDRFARLFRQNLETGVRNTAVIKSIAQEERSESAEGETSTQNDQEDTRESGRIERLKRRAHQVVEGIAHRMIGSGDAENLSTRQQVQQILEERIQQMHEALDIVLTEQTPRLDALLKEALERQGEMHLVFISPTVSTPQEKLARITEAEGLLRRRFS
jgi:hypothetical protein